MFKGLYKIVVDVAETEDNRGKLLDPRRLTYKTTSFYVQSQVYNEVFTKAGNRCAAEGWVFKNMNIVH